MPKACFVIGPIDKPGTEVRRRSDNLLHYIIKEVLMAEPLKFDAVERADEMATPGLITNQVIERVVNADLVVADLEGLNPNVMDEMVLRHALSKPVVHMVAVGQELPFDIKQQPSIYYDVPDLSSVDATKKELQKHAEPALKDKRTDNPISSAITTLDLLKSGDTEKKATGLILERLHQLSAEIRAIRKDTEGYYRSTFDQAKRSANLGFGGGDWRQTNPLYQAMGFQGSGTPDTLRAMGLTMGYGGLGTASGPVAPICANCGQPISGAVGRR